MTVALAALLLGSLLLYAGVTGRSVGSLLVGDAGKQAVDGSLVKPAATGKVGS